MKELKKTKKMKAPRDKALRAFQRYVRLLKTNSSGQGFCISCGKPIIYNACDGGHYIVRSVRPTELELDNVWAQCKICNGMKEGNSAQYRRHLIEKIGIERVERLENLDSAYGGSDESYARLSLEDRKLLDVKRTNKDYEELYHKYMRLGDQLEKEKAL